MKTARCRCAGILSLAVITACTSESIAPAPRVSRIELRHASQVAVVNEQISIEALAFDAKGVRICTPDLSWTSDDPTIATVDTDGRVTIALGESSYSSKGFPPISFFPVPQVGVALLTYRTDNGKLGWTVARGSLDPWGYGGGPLNSVPWNACGS